MMIGVWGNGVNAGEPVFLYEQDPTLLITTVQVIFLGGAASDPYEKAGLSNLLTELVLRGTQRRNRTQFQSEIERLGALLGAHSTHDLLVFNGRVIKENTKKFLELLTEAILFPAWDKKEWDSLKKEVLVEIANFKNNNTRLASLAVRRVIFEGTSLERSGYGGLQSVRKVSLDDLKAAYHERFRQNNLVVAVASPFPEPEIKDWWISFWKQLPQGGRGKASQVPLKSVEKPYIVLVQKPKTSTGSVVMAQGGIVATDPYRYPLLTANFAFGGEPLISRLFRVIRAELGWTYAIGSGYTALGPLSDQKGLYTITSTPSVEFTVKTVFKLLSMWEQFLKHGLKEEELKLAKESLINSYPFDFENAEKRLWHKLYYHLYGVPVLSQDEFSKEIGRITSNQIVEALKNRHHPAGWVIAVVADRGEFEKQLTDEQKSAGSEKRIGIDRVLTPDDVIR